MLLLQKVIWVAYIVIFVNNVVARGQNLRWFGIVEIFMVNNTCQLKHLLIQIDLGLLVFTYRHVIYLWKQRHFFLFWSI